MARRFVKSDESLFKIIEELEKTGSAGATELSERLDLSASTIHRHLQTMEKCGYAVNLNGEYKLSLHLFSLGSTIRLRQTFYQLSKEEMKNLAERTGETVWCVMEEQGRAMFIAGHARDPALNLDFMIGEWKDLHTSSAGKAILAHQPQDRIEEITEKYLGAGGTENTIMDPETLLKELEYIRTQGYAVNRGEHITGIHGIGMPVFVDNDVIGALSIAGTKSQLVDENRDEVLEQLSTTVENIEQKFRNNDDYPTEPGYIDTGESSDSAGRAGTDAE